MAELEELLNKISSPLIWVGDFNAHNPLWGSQVRDGNGAVVEELLDNCRLVVMNDSRPTRFDINTLKMSCLDLTIASPTLARVGEWDVLGKHSMGSDHFLFLSQFERSLIVVQGDIAKRFDFSRVEWGKFGVEIGKSLREINTEVSIDEFNDSLSKMIFDVA